MENKENLTIPNTLLNKSFFALIIFTCLFIIECSKRLIVNMLNSIPNINTFDFVIKYMQTNRHDLALGVFAVAIVMAVMIFSILHLINNFLEEEIIGRILSVILIATSIFVIIFAVWKSLIMFQLVGAIIFIGFMIVAMFSSFNSNKN